jgi:hypothetical protein
VNGQVERPVRFSSRPFKLLAAALERLAGWDMHPLESAAFHGAHLERTLKIVPMNGR